MQAGRLLVLDRSGRVKNRRFGLRELQRPVGLARSRDRIYVTDIGDHTVKIFTVKGKPVAEFGGYGDGDDGFAYPNGAAAAADGRIYVADSNNRRVQVFNKNGVFTATLPEPPRRRDRLILPRAIALDKSGRVHVVDALRGRVHVYDSRHRYLFNYGRSGPAGAKLTYPAGICIDNDTGLIYILDRWGDRVTVWAN
jgi:DNA-binding beta-propeller fold protein YncE